MCGQNDFQKMTCLFFVNSLLRMNKYFNSFLNKSEKTKKKFSLNI